VEILSDSKKDELEAFLENVYVTKGVVALNDLKGKYAGRNIKDTNYLLWKKLVGMREIWYIKIYLNEPTLTGKSKMCNNWKRQNWV